MKHVSTLNEIRQCVRQWRREGLRIGLVPTMGYFHQGHLSLMAHARPLCDKLVVSLFVNPIQFGPKEDLAAYPRDLDRDASMAEEVGVDVLFCPTAAEMYDQDFQTTVNVTTLAEGLCGASRPGHFTGVATVVTKLFNLITPHFAVFGEKDLQQLAVIRRIVEDLNVDVEIIGHPIVREADGLAMSSRNTYLTPAERAVAGCLFAVIQAARQRVAEADRPVSAAEIEATGRAMIESHPGWCVDYLKVVQRSTLQASDVINQDSVLALAVKVNNRVRLIDNAGLWR